MSRRSKRQRRAAQRAFMKEAERMGTLTETVATDGQSTTTRLTVIKDHILTYPELYMEIFVATDSKWEETQFAELFTRAKCTRADSPEGADLVVFTGGEDVDPALYGAKPHPKTRFNASRDSQEIDLFMLCRTKGIPMFGVCRGAQFLSVMHGGKLYQDVNNHHGDHSMYDHSAAVHLDRVSSVHHQMVQSNLNGGMKIIATSGKSSSRWTDNVFEEVGVGSDIEAFFYRDTCSLGIQGHPEYRGYNHFAVWSMQKIEEYIIGCPDIIWEGGNRRINPDILEQRERDFSLKNTSNNKTKELN